MGHFRETRRRVVCMDDLRERSYPEPNTGCLLWGGYLNRGYPGVAGPHRKPRKGHRLAWEFTHGPIPEGMFVCHSCDTPSCLNPDHLFLGTSDDNVQDRNRKGRTRARNPTHCKRGHEFTPENTRRTADGRACRACDSLRDRGCLVRRRAAASVPRPVHGDEFGLFFGLLKRDGLPLPETEVVFHPERKWRFDFLWRSQRVFLEVDGAIWTRGRHTRGAGWLKDSEKLNAAATLGYRHLRCTPQQLETLDLIATIRAALDYSPEST